MKFTSRLNDSIDSGRRMPLRPELLLLPQVPKPMHGLAPRVVLGRKWWDTTRRAAYQSTNGHCLACGVHKLLSRGPKWLEAHEIYRVDYLTGRMVYLETVPLCNYCHSFIHIGRLESLLERRKITQRKFADVLAHGERILANAGLTKKQDYKGPFAPWLSWRLVVNRKMFKPRFESLEELEKHYAKI